MKKNNTIQKKHKHRHSHDHISIDSYAYLSKLRDWNAGFKVLFSITTLVLCILMDNPIVSAVILITMTYLVVKKSGMDFNEWLALFTIPVVFLVLGVLAVMFDFSKQPHDWNVAIGSIYLYTSFQMMINGLFLFLRVMGAVSAMYFMILTTPAHELIGVLRHVHLPSLIVELMYLIYRYIFILLQTQRKMRISAESRLGFCDYRTSLKSFGNIASNLMVVSLKRAGTYYDAMESRCYDGELMFLEEKKPLKIQLVIGAVVFEGILVLLGVFIK